MIKGNVAIFPVKKSAKSIRGIKSYDCFSWEIFPPSFPRCWEGAFPTLWEGAFPTFGNVRFFLCVIPFSPTEIELFFFTNLSQLVFPI